MKGNDMGGKWILALAALLFVAPIAGAAQPEMEGELILGISSMWRYHYTLRPPVMRTDGELEAVNRGTVAGTWLDFPTPLPPGDWHAPEFDDVGWHRKMMVDPDSPFVAHLAIRGKFRVGDPRSANGLKLHVGYRGGIAVYVNGTEIARGHLKEGAAPEDLAEDYPAGEPEQARQLADIAIPPDLLREGPNVLAFEVHRSAQPQAQVKPVEGYTEITAGTCGITTVRLITPEGPEGAAVTPNVTRPPGLQVWNSGPIQADYECDYGDPNELLKPIRIVAPRGGAGSGKVVVGSKEVIAGLRAGVSGLAREDGAGAIPASALQVRYALPTVIGPAYYFPGQGRAWRCEALDEVPPEEAPLRYANILTWTQRKSLEGAVVAVWVTVEVPPDAAPGDYAGTLTITPPAAAPISVPVELQVCPWRVPDPSEYHVFVDVVQSPESTALRYELPLWSEEHWRLVAKSLRLLGQIGNKVCYVPLICDTNQGNAESMVRWIKRPDGTYAHDFSIMDKYLDLVTEHQGPPSVVCIYVWDTYLEGGLSGRHPGGEEIVEVRKEQMENGPLVSMLEEAGGTVEKVALPRYSEAQSRALWEPLLKEVRRRMEERGLAEAMMWGYATDHMPTPEVVAHFEAILPGVRWVCCAHNAFKTMQISHVPVGFAIGPYAWKMTLFGVDPSLERMQGWKGENLICHFPRRLWDRFCHTTYRFIGEMNATGKRRGFARLGGDFLAVGTDRRGRRVGTLAGRFPKTSWRQLNILTSLLEPGQEGPVATARFEMLREGLQECEARIFIEQALGDEGKRAQLGEDLAGRCQDLLDERARNMFRAVSTLWAKAGTAVRCCYFGTSWWNWPPIIGSHWFASSDWQAETARLYEAAAEVEAKLPESRAQQ
ncbi:MAG: hypothetical protein KAX44_02645 [Candidatus Brocadiae bacterium]|nr:hypothetical protein [Candidatus Brocadiia bacterium]